MKLNFPKGFLWGTATSAHQIEGNNKNNDWWAWEKTGKNPPSGLACDSYHRYEEDFDFAKEMNNNAHRLSIEWSRLEAQEGKWDLKEIEHYRQVFQALKRRQIKIILTLHHFTNPLWFSQKGGWENPQSPQIFARYVEKVVQEFGEEIDFWITLNEPMIYALQGYYGGKFPPGKKSLKSFFKVLKNLIKGHQLAYQTIHQIIPPARVGFAQNPPYFTAWPKETIFNRFFLTCARYFWSHRFYKKTRGSHDFIGINFYFHFRIKLGLFNYKVIESQDLGFDHSDTGWEIDPEAFYQVLLDFRKYHLPIYITENGIATTNENQRIKYLISYLAALHRAMEKGVAVAGYFYWSLLDNFEWESGFGPRFGLVKVNFQTQERTLTPAGKIYGKIAKENAILGDLHD